MFKNILRVILTVLFITSDVLTMFFARDASRIQPYAEHAKSAMAPKVKVKLANGKSVKINL